jgi:hypothetical protein
MISLTLCLLAAAATPAGPSPVEQLLKDIARYERELAVTEKELGRYVYTATVSSVLRGYPVNEIIAARIKKLSRRRDHFRVILKRLRKELDLLLPGPRIRL